MPSLVTLEVPIESPPERQMKVAERVRAAMAAREAAERKREEVARANPGPADPCGTCGHPYGEHSSNYPNPGLGCEHIRPSSDARSREMNPKIWTRCSCDDFRLSPAR